MISFFRSASMAVSIVVCFTGFTVLAGCSSTPARVQTPTHAPPRSSEADAKIRLADQAAAKGDSDTAVTLYREAIVLDRDRYVAWNNLGVELMNRGDYLDAVAALKVASDLSPRDPRPVANIGLAYQQMGWANDALEYYEQALHRDETFLDALRGFALAEELLGRGSLQSLEQIKRALMVEKDQEWRTFFERRKFRVEALLRSSDL
jgi:tetratricopeptide (TPR) repeat protein